MPEILTPNSKAALARAQTSYLFPLMLLPIFALVSSRSGAQWDEIIPYTYRNWVRIGEVVYLISGLVLVALYVRRTLDRRASELGEAHATVESIAEDFCRAKRYAVLAFAVPAYVGLGLVMAGYKPTSINILLLVLPIFLMLFSWPTEAGMRAFAVEVNGPEPVAEEAESEEVESEEAPASEGESETSDPGGEGADDGQEDDAEPKKAEADTKTA